MQLSALTSSLGRFLGELQRRKVLRIAAAYLVAAWIILQVALALQTTMSLAASFSSSVLALLVIGFPIVVGLSWFFEFTPEGIKRTVASSEGATFKPQTTDFVLAGALALVFSLGVAQFFWPRDTVPAAQTTAAVAPAADAGQPPRLGDKSIAVLPFANLSPAKENEYFADGLTEELLNLLAKIGDLKVISRTSSFAFKGKSTPLPEIARQLGVRHILEGSVRAEGEELRITAQLIDVATDTHLWSETYERKIESLFALQDEIARAISSALKVEVTLAGTNKPPTASIQAYRSYLEALSLFRTREFSAFDRVIELMQTAIKLDKDFAEAHALLSAAYGSKAAAYGSRFDVSPGDAAIWAGLARKSALTALKLKPTLGAAHAALGRIDRRELRWEEAVANGRKAVELDPGNSDARLWLGGTLAILGHIAEGVRLIEEAANSDPLSEIGPAWLMYTEAIQGNDAAATKIALKLQHSSFAVPSGFANYYLAARAYDAGNADEAARHYQAMLYPASLRDRPFVEAIAKALRSPLARDAALRAIQAEAAANPMFDPGAAYALLRANDALIERVNTVLDSPQRIAFVTGSFSWIWAPRHKELHRHPSIKALFRKMGLVDYWKKHGWPDRCRAKGEDDFECS
jgi:TolB-like protein